MPPSILQVEPLHVGNEGLPVAWNPEGKVENRDPRLSEGRCTPEGCKIAAFPAELLGGERLYAMDCTLWGDTNSHRLVTAAGL